jgi:hypothetical protein
MTMTPGERPIGVTKRVAVDAQAGLFRRMKEAGGV